MLKEILEARAKESGRSLSEEIEHRLELSTASGGLLRLLAAAAEIIEAKTGKSWSSDWDTFQAVQAAWRKLIPAAGPKPPRGLVDLLKTPAPPIPILPVLPMPPTLPSRAAKAIFPDLVPDPDKEQKAFEEKCATYKKDVAAYKKNKKRYEEYSRQMKQERKRLEELSGIGQKVATDLFKVTKKR